MNRYLYVMAIIFFIFTAEAAFAEYTNYENGERIYREGLLSDGTPLKGYVKGDVEIDSTQFSCSNCHTRSGLGSIEGQITSPPINGASLFKPRYLFKDQIKNVISKSKGITRLAKELRPAYTDETLAGVLRGGIDPVGRELAPIMPRYNLSDKEMQNLIKYLRNLSALYSPGVTDKSLTFATIITDDVSETDRQAMLASLDTLVNINQQTENQRKYPQFAKMFRMLDTAFFRKISIKSWVLHGEPSTWSKQLDEYYKKEPVFAFLGGISNKSWQPIHDFCELNQIPCLFPITDLPVVSTNSWYTYYASKGFYQEGETAARFIVNDIRDGFGGKVLQLVKTTEQGNALESGFNSAWNDAGVGKLETVRFDKNKKLDAVYFQKLLKQYGPDTIVIWTDDDAVTALSELTADIKSLKIIVSSRYIGKSFSSFPEVIRSNLFITYPYRLPEDEKPFKGYKEFLTLGKLKQPDEKRIATRTFSMIHIFLQGLKELKLDFYRDTLLDVIAMRPDQYLPDFERYSFGPGQRYASKGCYIVQLDKGVTVRLIKKSDWVLF